MDIAKSDKRAVAPVLTEKNGLEWKLVFTSTNLTVGKILDHLMITKLKDFSEGFYNGSHFSRDTFLFFQKYNSLNSGLKKN